MKHAEPTGWDGYWNASLDSHDICSQTPLGGLM
jgi:hypothetical protein